MSQLLPNLKTSMDLNQMMTAEEMTVTGANLLTTSQQLKLAAWGMKMFILGQHRVSEIEEIKYGGRLIILQDGSRWEVNELDTTTAESWSPLDKVVVIEDSIWRLDDLERVEAEEEL